MCVGPAAEYYGRAMNLTQVTKKDECKNQGLFYKQKPDELKSCRYEQRSQGNIY